MVDIFQKADESAKGLSADLIASLRDSLKEILNSVNTNPRSDIEVSSGVNGKTSNHTLAILGAAAILTGGIGWICAATWGKWVLFSGVAAVGMDTLSSIRREESKNSVAPKCTIPLSTRYEIVQEVSRISDNIADKWNAGIESIKESLLHGIDHVNASENEKVDANYKLYTTEQISYSLNAWIPRFESASDIKRLTEAVSEFGAYFTGLIEKACTKQCEAYKEAKRSLH